MFTVPMALMLLVLAELTYSDPQKMYAFLQLYVAQDGTFPDAAIVQADPDLVAEALSLLQQQPTLVIPRVDPATSYGLCVNSADVPRGVVAFTTSDDQGQEHGESLIHIVDTIMAAMDENPETNPGAIMFDLLYEACRRQLETWVMTTFVPYKPSGVLH